MGDIDFFKKINDTHGHPAGDAVLKSVAKKLLESMRGEDCVGRLGGEEFLMILTDCTAQGMFETVNRIRETVEENPVLLGKQTCPVTMSFGAALAVPDGTIDSGELIERADKALYSAKHKGRNRVEMA